MKQLFFLIGILLLSVFSSTTAKAQTTIEYAYDNSGNRITRTVITLKNASIASGFGAEQQTPELLEAQVGLQETIIYPNPTKGLLRIDFPSLTGSKASIRVHDAHGKLIVHKSAAGSNQVDLSFYPSGYYIMTIHIGQVKKEWKIIKE